MIYLLLTADYEVFDNGTRDVLDCVIRPTNNLLDICETYGAKLTIFFEVCEYWAFKQAQEEGKLEHLNYEPAIAMERQLQDAIRRGHDVQLHLHPQWLSWKIDEGNWTFDLSQSRISSLDENTLKNIFLKGKKTLETMLMPISDSYKGIAFRAGHLSIQPEQKVLKVMKETGFLLESSVAPGIYSDNSQYYYDFRNSPSKPFWKISKSVTEEDPQGSIWEIPMMTKFMYPWQRDLKNKVGKIMKNLFNPPNSSQKKFVLQKQQRAWQRFLPKYYLLDISDSFQIMEAFIITAFKNSFDEEIYPVVMLGHPFYFTDSSDFNLFLKRCSEWVNNKKMVFCSFREFSDILQNS